jgi:hypothetical protein
LARIGSAGGLNGERVYQQQRNIVVSKGTKLKMEFGD